MEEGKAATVIGMGVGAENQVGKESAIAQLRYERFELMQTAVEQDAIGPHAG